MSETTTAVRNEPPGRPLELGPGTLEFFQLGDLGAELESREEYRRSGVAGVTLARHERATLLLVALRAGAEMREHRAPSVGMVVMLSGRTRFTRGADDPGTELATGSLAVFSADMPHALHALEDARYLVVIGGRERPNQTVP